MAIYEYTDEKSGQFLFRISVVKKSKINPTLKIQRTESGIKNRELAEKKEAQLQDDALRELIAREQQGDTWCQFVEKWSQALVTGEGMEIPVSRVTADDYANVVMSYTKDWNKRAVSSITRLDIKMAIDKLKSLDKSHSRRRYLKTALTRAFQWGIDTRTLRGIHDNPVHGISLGKKIEKKQSVLTQSEAKTLLASARRLEHPWYPVWAMALLTGMRSGELYALVWEDVDFESELIHVTKSYNCRTRSVKTPKSGDWRTIPINEELMSLLRELKIKAHGNNHVLPRFGDWESGNQAVILRQFCKGLGITEIRFHDLRACFSTYLWNDGIAGAQIMKICGWKDLKTMQRYMRLAAVDIKGATSNLRILPDKEVMGRVINLVKG